MHTFAQRLVAWRWPLLAIGVVLALAAIPSARQLQFDRSIENMFADDDPLLVPFRRLQRTFGAGEIVLAAYDDPELMTPQGVARAERIAGELQQIDGIATVVGLHSFIGERIVDPDHPVAARLRELFTGYTHGPDGRTAALICLLEPQNDDAAATIDQARDVIGRRPSGVLAGEPVMVVDGFRYVERDGKLLGWTSTLLLMLTIVLCFRSLRWVLIPIAVVQLSLLLTRAVLVWSGLRLSMVSSMLTAIVTVIAVATTMHVIVRFRQRRAEGLDPRAAMTAAAGWLAVPVTWACLTDAAGFAALLVAEVGPVRDFGLMMVVGSLMVLVSIGLLVPGLALLGRFDVDPQRAWGEGMLDIGLDRVAACVHRHPAAVGVATLAAAVAAGLGVLRLEVETDFTRNFRADSPIAQSYDFVETRLGGAGLWDVVLPAPERLDPDYLRRVTRLQQRLRDEVAVEDDRLDEPARLVSVLSLADAVDAVNVFQTPILGRFVERFVTAAALNRLRSRIPGLAETLHAEDPRHAGQYYYRIMLRGMERHPAEVKQALIDQVTSISREEFPQAEVTGFYVLLTSLVDSVLRDQWITFALASLGIGLMMLLAQRSFKLAVVALVPNGLPILMVMGMLGWLGLKLNMGAAMIAAVSIGLSVDSSVHYLTSFRRLRDSGAETAQAIGAAHQAVGRAIVFATLALIVGFSAMLQSEFVPTIYFGMLVSLSMLGGLLGNLIVLPLLLRWVGGRD